MSQKTGLRKSPFSQEDKARVVADFERYINTGQVAYLRAGHLDVIESERKGVTFVDPLSGRRMFDCFSSAGSFNVSRHNSKVLSELVEAVDHLDMGLADDLSPSKLLLAERLTQLAPGDLNRVIFASGGGDAVDCAIKLARGATGRSGIVSTIKAYHGHTGFALSANGKPHYREYCEPLMPGVSFAPFNDLDAAKAMIGPETAAVIVEPVQGEAGIFIGTPEYLSGLRAACDKAGALLIFDEIQTGFGRTGKLFACEHSGVVPDILTLAKSLGGGLFPNAAVLLRETPLIMDYLTRNPRFHESIDGGSDLGCAVSLAVLSEIERMDLCFNAERQGKRLKEALKELQAENPRIIKDIRGIGLMVGIEYIHEFMGPMMSDALAKHGVFAAYSGNAPQVMRFMAPITIDGDEMTDLIRAVRAAVHDMKMLLPLALPATKVPALLKLLNNEHVQTALFGVIRKIEDRAGALIRFVKGGPNA
jgi:acetylornithine/succinyldiaminopimelate/putrescine aminotransferase